MAYKFLDLQRGWNSSWIGGSTDLVPCAPQGEIELILGFNNKLAQFAVECNGHARHAYKIQTGEDRICLRDPTVYVDCAFNPEIGTEWEVDVETQRELTRGLTLVNRLNVGP